MKIQPNYSINKPIKSIGNSKKYPEYEIHGLDCLTYASNEKYIAHLKGYPNYKFVRLDIRDRNKTRSSRSFSRPNMKDIAGGSGTSTSGGISGSPIQINLHIPPDITESLDAKW